MNMFDVGNIDVINSYLKKIETKINSVEFKLKILNENNIHKNKLYNKTINDMNNLLNKIEYYDEEEASTLNNDIYEYLGGYRDNKSIKRVIIKSKIDNISIFDKTLRDSIKREKKLMLLNESFGSIYEDKINWIKCFNKNINPYELTKKSDKYVYTLCDDNFIHNFNIHGEFEGIYSHCSTYKGKCVYCGGKNIRIHWLDSVAYNYPKVTKNILNSNHNLTLKKLYETSCNSNLTVITVCDDCGKELKRSIRDSCRCINFCKYCNDNISLPNKYLRIISEKLKLNFNFEDSIYIEGKCYRSDAYDKNNKIRIEMDASYKENHIGERLLIDNLKDEYCLKNRHEYTIRINLMDKERYKRKPNEYIKEAIINSPMNLIYDDLDKLDWEEIRIEANKSLYVKVWELYNEVTHDQYTIAKITNLNKRTVLDILKYGSEINMVDYNKKDSIEEGNEKIRGIKSPCAIAYKVIYPNGKEEIKCKSELCNWENKKGILNITKVTFDKYISPHDGVYIDIIENDMKKLNQRINKKLLEKLKPFDCTIIKILK